MRDWWGCEIDICGVGLGRCVCVCVVFGVVEGG
jgi:hypothetical protein